MANRQGGRPKTHFRRRMGAKPGERLVDDNMPLPIRSLNVDLQPGVDPKRRSGPRRTGQGTSGNADFVRHGGGRRGFRSIVLGGITTTESYGRRIPLYMHSTTQDRTGVRKGGPPSAWREHLSPERLPPQVIGPQSSRRTRPAHGSGLQRLEIAFLDLDRCAPLKEIDRHQQTHLTAPRQHGAFQALE
jgi:hypothetical protein